MAGLAALGVALLGCGYQPLYGAGNHPRYGVVIVDYKTVRFEAVQATANGVRAELGRAQALGSGYPRVEVEVLRVDEQSTGLRAGAGAPSARGSEVVVVGRARTLTERREVLFDSGDVSRSARFAAGGSAEADAAAHARAVKDAGEELGRALGRALLGLPEPLEG